ncbi:YlmH family RNA-binding protein [Natronincola ferrireducens]|uniref:RNA-binding protein YlmH, contains S4-like domain n=1 Tax=Natronincola ferrireducens TaxID=393762 RepID=A0A1G9BT89_9FIRM|nr:YlmH/Sll1252 family protein [Natronincola ferrireducens]SDK42195.1 RNA-binding protein YlmH, contains S4-like domain [Natronincola ferrireducens]
MIDKEQYIHHIKDDALRHSMVKILDKVEGVLRNHDIKGTDFLNPYEITAVEEVLSNFENIAFKASGGYKGAERQVLVIFQDYLALESVKIPVAALELTGNIKFKTLNHRDYLGAILSLGVKREKVGDIIINENSCQIVLQEELKDFLKFHLNKVGNVSISIKEIGLEELKPLDVTYKELSGTVASLRLDSIVSLGFKVPRSEAQSLIAKERVYINWKPINKNFYEIHPSDVISVRGRGRIIVEGIQGETKSGRVHIKLKKPI